MRSKDSTAFIQSKTNNSAGYFVNLCQGSTVGGGQEFLKWCSGAENQNERGSWTRIVSCETEEVGNTLRTYVIRMLKQKVKCKLEHEGTWVININSASIK